MQDCGKPRKEKSDYNFTFTGIFKCGECGRSITAEQHTKKSGLVFRYYRCTQKDTDCQQKFLNENDLFSQLNSIFQKVALPDDWLKPILNDILPALKSGVSLQRGMTYKRSLALLPHCQRSIHLRSKLRSVLECCYKYLYLLPLLFSILVNTHIGFITGLLLLPSLYMNQPLRKKWVVILPFIMALLATCLNPFGPKVYLEIYRHLQAPLSTTIAEWVAPPLWLKGLAAFFILELSLFLAAKKRLRPSFLINLLIFTILSFLGMRNLVFLSALIAIYLGICLCHLRMGRFFNLEDAQYQGFCGRSNTCLAG